MSESETLPKIPRRQVIEIVKVTGDTHKPVGMEFERVIHSVAKEGYELENWQMSCIARHDEDGERVVETIVAVFIQRFVVEVI